LTISQGEFSKIETGNFTAFIYSRGRSPIHFDHTDLEILEKIFQHLETIDLDLIYGILHAMDGKYLTSSDWMKLIEVVRGFDPKGVPFVFEEHGSQYLTIGDVKYPVELDETLSPGEWYIKGKAENDA